MKLEAQRDHAARLLALVVQDPEYSFVYEDDELMDKSEKVQRSIYDLMTSATITVSWPDSDDVYTIAGDSDE